MADIYTNEGLTGALRQQEILSNVKVLNAHLPGERENVGEKVEAYGTLFPFVIIVSQDCDLDADYRSRFGGRHNLSKEIGQVHVCILDPKSNKLPRAIVNTNKLPGIADLHFLEQNRHDRLYWLEKIQPDKDLLSKGSDEELIIDFKLVYGIPTNYLYHQINTEEAQRRCVLLSPHKERCAQKFHNWQGRIGLDTPYESFT